VRLLWGFLAVAAASPGHAGAQEGGPAIAELMDEAADALRREDYARALDLFTRAYAATRRPLHLYNIGMCHRELLEPALARETLVRYVEEGRGREPPERLAEAEALVAELEAGLAPLVLEVTRDGATVLIDGDTVGASPLVAPVWVEPGAYVVEARQDGFVPARAEVTAEAGRPATIRLDLALAAPPAGDAAGLPVAAAPDEEEWTGLPAWFWIPVAVAGAAAASAAVTGGLMLDARSDYLDGGRRDVGLYDRTIVLRDATDGLLVVAGAGLIAAGVIWLAWDGEEDEAAARVTAVPGGVVVAW
jgi:hypothetical protein